MTLLEAKTRSVEPLDFYNPEHRALLFDLAVSNADHLLNDVDNDIVLIINGYQQRAEIGEIFAFIALDGEEKAGCFWLEVDRYGIGRVRGALLPEHRNLKNFMYFLRGLVRFGFETLELRKLDAELSSTTVKRDRYSIASEKLLKKIGFKFTCHLKESLMVNGEPRDTVLMHYLKRDYDVKRQQF